METERDRMIRERAYALWEQGGRRADSEHEDWLEAERSFAAGSEGLPVDEAPSEAAAGPSGGTAAAAAQVAAPSAAAKPAAAVKPSKRGRP